MRQRTTSWLGSILAAGALAACGAQPSYDDPTVRGSAEGTRAGEGLSAAARGGITWHGAEPGPGSDSRPDYGDDPQAILPTPQVHVQPYHPEPVRETEDGMMYRTRIDVTNRGGAPTTLPRIALDVELRAADRRQGCEVVSMTTYGPPEIAPGETVQVVARSVCPRVEGEHEVVSMVELPELTGDDGLVAGRTVVTPIR